MKNVALPLITLLVLLATGCSDILEKDLTGYGVVLVAPPDGYTTSANVVTFRWDAVPETEGYRLQIATPDFLNPALFAYDTLVTNASYTAALVPGNYRWRVRAENPNSHTDYYERSLVVTEASSLEGLTPILLQPGSNSATSAATIAFSWNTLTGAQDYRFEIREDSQTGPLVQAQIVADTEIELTDIAEGSYAWGVQAQNATSSSIFSYRLLRVDRTLPTSPVLLAPTNNSTLPNAPFDFEWQSGSDAATSTTDSLFVLDSNAVAIRQLPMATTTYTDSLGVGDYTWYVRTTDEAGNGASSPLRAFTVQ